MCCITVLTYFLVIKHTAESLYMNLFTQYIKDTYSASLYKHLKLCYDKFKTSMKKIPVILTFCHKYSSCAKKRLARSSIACARKK